MNVLKSEEKASIFRDKGNIFYRYCHFRNALILYNQSLCYAVSRKSKALAYANRSAVYMETKNYSLCLVNIQLALDYGYPEEKISKLNERKDKCKTLMKQYIARSDDNPWNFFKLSYPANKKIPFIVDCLELKEDSKHDRRIITNRDLNPGDIIAIEEPFFRYLNKFHCYEKCDYCMKSNFLSLIPCKGPCVNTMFCSKKCANISNKVHGQCSSMNILSEEFALLDQATMIAGSLKKLQALMLNSNSDRLTIFDFDMTKLDSKETQLCCLKAFLALSSKHHHMEELDEEIVARWVTQLLPALPDNMFDSVEDFSLFWATVLRLAKINAANRVLLKTNLILKSNDELKELFSGSGIFLFGSLINESCNPNVYRVSVDGKIALVVQFPIKAGNQLITHSDIKSLTQEDKCACNDCKKYMQLPESVHTEISHTLLHLSTEGMKTSNPVEDFKRNSEEIKKNFKHHPCRKTLLPCIHNAYLLTQISKFGSI